MMSKIAIEGMSCGGCSANIERVVRAMDGVVSAVVSLSEKLATIDHDEKVASINAICSAIEDAGFEATAL